MSMAELRVIYMFDGTENNFTRHMHANLSPIVVTN